MGEVNFLSTIWRRKLPDEMLTQLKSTKTEKRKKQTVITFHCLFRIGKEIYVSKSNILRKGLKTVNENVDEPFKSFYMALNDLQLDFNNNTDNSIKATIQTITNKGFFV